MTRTPTSEILITMQVVKQMQVDMTALAKVVEKIGERVMLLEARVDSATKS